MAQLSVGLELGNREASVMARLLHGGEEALVRINGHKAVHLDSGADIKYWGGKISGRKFIRRYLNATNAFPWAWEPREPSHCLEAMDVMDIQVTVSGQSTNLTITCLISRRRKPANQYH